MYSVVFQILSDLLFISLKCIVFIRLRTNTLNLKLLKQIIIPKLCSFSSFSHCNYEDCVHIQILDFLVSFGEMKLYKYCKCFDSSWSYCWCWQYLCYWQTTVWSLCQHFNIRTSYYFTVGVWLNVNGYCFQTFLNTY